MSYILDSTLRDGAYAFGNSMPLAYVKLITKTLDGLVDFVEVGSSVSFGFGTKSSFSEDLIRLRLVNNYLKKSKSAIFIQASMIDPICKEYRELLDEKPGLIRLGIDPEIDFDENNITLINSFHKNKIPFAINMMKAYRYTQYQIDKLLELVNTYDLCQFLSVVDSAGCMNRSEFFNLTNNITCRAKANIGVHIHNNTGNADSISLEYLEKGFSVDSTFLGKGRMGGNADTILMVLYKVINNIDSNQDIDLICSRLLEGSSPIWGNEAREHLISVLIGLTGLHSSRLTNDLLSSLNTLPKFKDMISIAWE